LAEVFKYGGQEVMVAPLSDRVGGYCDGIVGNQIVGWIINHDKVNALESVFVESDLGERLEFKAIVYRLDIPATLGRYEKFGFAIPLAALPKFKHSVRLFNRYGNPLGNGVVDLAHLQGQQPPRHQHCTIFLHIPKTAGTSLTTALRKQVPDGDVCLYYPGHVIGLDWDMVHLLPAHQCKAFKLLIGHMAFGIDTFLQQPSKYYTFLREPIARLKSHYWHCRAYNENTLTIDGDSVPLHAAVQEGLNEEFDNMQTRLIAGAFPDTVPLGQMSDAVLNLALDNIDRSFCFVGLTEKIDLHAKIMFEKMGIEPVAIARENAAPASLVNENDEDYRRIDWNKVRENNKYDIALYQIIAARAP
jgi:hypothetical protein